MSLVHMNSILAFTISMLGLLMYRAHLMSSLLCLEGMMLSLFTMGAMIILITNFMLANMLLIVLLVFAACEAAVGLSLLVMMSNTYGTDYIQNLNLLQC